MTKTCFYLYVSGPMPDTVNHFHFSPFNIDTGSEFLSREYSRKPSPFKFTYEANYLPPLARQQILKTIKVTSSDIFPGTLALFFPL